MIGSCFLTQFAILCLLIGTLRPLIYSVSIERYVVCPVIFIPLFTYSLIIGLLGQKGLFFLASSCLTLVSSVC
jgi:hypothetical protein